MIGRRTVAERVGASTAGDELGRRVGVENQVDDRVDGRAGVAAEGVVEQVIEDPPVQLGLAAVVGQEPESPARSGLPRGWPAA